MQSALCFPKFCSLCTMAGIFFPFVVPMLWCFYWACFVFFWFYFSVDKYRYCRVVFFFFFWLSLFSESCRQSKIQVIPTLVFVSLDSDFLHSESHGIIQSMVLNVCYYREYLCKSPRCPEIPGRSSANAGVWPPAHSETHWHRTEQRRPASGGTAIHEAWRPAVLYQEWRQCEWPWTHTDPTFSSDPVHISRGWCLYGSVVALKLYGAVNKLRWLLN